MRTAFESLVVEKTLARMSEMRNDSLMDAVLDGQVEMVEGTLPIKNVCARVSIALADRIDGVVAVLGVSKRRFIETIFLEAVERAEALMEQEGWNDFMTAYAEEEQEQEKAA